MQCVEYLLDVTRHPERKISMLQFDAWLNISDIPVQERHPSMREEVFLKLLLVLVERASVRLLTLLLPSSTTNCACSELNAFVCGIILSTVLLGCFLFPHLSLYPTLPPSSFLILIESLQ